MRSSSVISSESYPAYNKKKVFKLLRLRFAFLIIVAIFFAQDSDAQRLSFDKGWSFHLGDVPFPVITGHGMSYANAKAGRAWGAAAPEFDDSDWRVLNLPHDWAVDQPFDSTANLSQGYKQRGIGWYRRSFKIDNADHGKYLELQFDGISTFCTIWVNGTLVHRNWCGYTSSYIDITPFAKYGEEINTIAVRVDAIAQEGWWYEGAGMYRHAWLVKRSPVHIVTDGVYAQPVKSNGLWGVPVEVTIENSGKKESSIEVESTLIDPKGKEIVQSRVNAQAASLDKTVASLSLPIANPQLWTLDKPTLYKVRTILKQSGAGIDTLITSCGFRTIRFTADSGFYLNDKRVKLKGTCNHQDHAGIGVAVPNSIWDFRLKKLKEMGVNAYRCSHNPPAAEFLEACDRIGILVMDENRNFNTSPEYMRQMEWMVRRDRNHPSIILWSVFNEEPMAGSENGYEMVRRMNAVVKKLDTTRYVTAAASGGLFAPVNVSQAVDIVGFNYQVENYDRFHKENPTMKMISSEDESALDTRGEYTSDLKKHFLADYDSQTSDWGTTHRVGWKAIAERPFIAGCFVWTGFDYRGEPQPFNWPTASSSFGIMDMCGFPKTAFYIHQAQWVDDRPILHLVPHWTWPVDSIGKKIKIMAMTNADKVKLILNGKEIGEQVVDKYEMNTWEIPYTPGRLEAISYKNGKEVAHFVTETAGKPVKLQLIPDRQTIKGEGWDAVPVTVRVLDAKGLPVENANLPVTFEVQGPGVIIGLGNGNANSHEPDKGNQRSLYNGLAQVILQSAEGGEGKLMLIAKSEGLVNDTVSITVLRAPQIPFVPIQKQLQTLNNWRLSPFFSSRPDPNQKVTDFDQNSWAPVKPGTLQQFVGGSFAIYRTTFRPFKAQSINGGTVILKDVTGSAEVYLDEKLVKVKTSKTKADIEVKFVPGNTEHQLNILIKSSPDSKAGLAGTVIID
ncbi:beta-galactosidase [Mucilaginibacter frigoritolerans]|uniref:Beta-galactosidase n=1 Tax=Mucilaginibacter frigoritolerans TaxID=652788 RepID=A0A562TMM5_9SPHI|nr:beta-galactosidase GalA [Mucilaginibacter frigoritolerans]TWI94807.1 beta-galactosidase [Mucilaginibacter frigoritolerans]